MHPVRIAELLLPFLSNRCHSEQGQRPSEEPAVLSESQLQSISTYIDILQTWNARINLTAIRNEEEIVTRHFGESLFAATHLFPKVYPVNPVPSVVKGADVAVGVGVDVAVGVDLEVPEAQSPKPEARLVDPRFPFYPVSSSVSSVPSVVKGVGVDLPEGRLADLGSGAGFPGIPIKLWAPKVSMTLIESNQKKATFLKEVVRALTLTDINIQNVRAETLPPSTFDVVTLRAVERPSEILPIAAKLVAPNGRLALLISSSQIEKTRRALPNLAWAPPIPIPQSESRVLLIGTKEPNKITSGT
jgi:16S rRNA (guanine(527)-N(7))-methyltransferase RsmG